MPIAVRPIDDAAAAAVFVLDVLSGLGSKVLGVLSGLSSKVLGAPRGPGGRGIVAGNNIICKNRHWVQKKGRKGLVCGAWTQSEWVLDQPADV